MTYKTASFLLCEAASIDFRGNASLIGILPSRVSAVLPAQMAPTLCAIFEQAEPAPVATEGVVDVAIQGWDPSGDQTFFARQGVPLAAGPLNGEAHRINLLMQVPLNVTQYGSFRITVMMKVPQIDGSVATIADELALLITDDSSPASADAAG